MYMSAQVQPPYWSLWKDISQVFGVPGIVTTSDSVLCDQDIAMAIFLTQLLCHINAISKDNKEIIRLRLLQKNNLRGLFGILFWKSLDKTETESTERNYHKDHDFYAESTKFIRKQTT